MSDEHLFKSSSSKESCIRLANHLITQCSLPISHVRNISEINSNLIVSLHEAITGLSVPDLLSCENEVAEAHNVQAVIDTLSLDFLGISLSHITGDAVVSGDVVAIFNLLEVLEGIVKHFSIKSNGQRVLKRKICRIKNSSSRSAKQNSNSKENTEYPSSSEGSQSENISSTFLEGKRIKSAFSKTRLKAKESLKNRGFKEICIPNETTVKGSSISLLTSSQTPVLNLSPENGTSISSSVHEDSNQVNAEQSSSQELPIFSKKSKASERLLPNAEDFSATDQQKVSTNIKTPPLVMKRKIAKLPNNKSKVENLSSEQEVEKLYDQNFETKLKGLLEKHSCLRTSQLKKSHLQYMKKPLKRPEPKCNKSFLLPHTLRRRSAVHEPKKHKISQKNSSQKLTSSKEVLALKHDCENQQVQHISFIKALLDEFPGIELSPTIMNHVRTKYEQHLLAMHRKVKACLLKKSKAEIEEEKAAEKQRAISKILKKDLHQQQYLNELKEQKNYQNKIKYRLRDARLKSAKMKQYYDEFHQEMRKKMQKRNFSEEIIFENVFKEAINIQKDHVDHLCQEIIDTGEADSKQYLTYLMSLENLYRSQFSLLSETLANEKRDAQTRIKAEKQVMDKMQRDFQQVLKTEIRFMQKVIVDHTEDCHFREMDAEQYIERIRDENI